MQIVMFRNLWRSHRLSRNEDARRNAAGCLTAALHFIDDSSDGALEYLRAEELRGLRESDPRYILNLVDQAGALAESGRCDDALELVEPAYAKAKLRGDDGMLCVLAERMARVLLACGRREEALPFAAEAVETAERSLHHVVQVRNTRATYAQVLSATGRRQEARAIYQKELEILERVYGPDHGHTTHVRTCIDKLSS
mmetsp:Transcript_24855/g.80392  ORF Transcript_24855/g.80392 Transcript_24855/m.80392 type:complete len:198 (-) Transcript_24855:1676-2269(-)